jgi:hypothetical protein
MGTKADDEDGHSELHDDKIMQQLLYKLLKRNVKIFQEHVTFAKSGRTRVPVSPDRCIRQEHLDNRISGIPITSAWGKCMELCLLISHYLFKSMPSAAFVGGAGRRRTVQKK